MSCSHMIQLLLLQARIFNRDYNRNFLAKLIFRNCVSLTCLNKICSEPEILFNSDKFTQLSAPLLEIILKRGDLALDEIEIWENLIKWGLAQEQAPNVNQDVSKWN